jgi:hypothetical protein
MSKKNMLVLFSTWKYPGYGSSEFDVDYENYYNILKQYYKDDKLQFCAIISITNEDNPNMTKIKPPPHTDVYYHIGGNFPNVMETNPKLKNAKFDVILVTDPGSQRTIDYLSILGKYCKNNAICLISNPSELMTKDKALNYLSKFIDTFTALIIKLNNSEDVKKYIENYKRISESSTNILDTPEKVSILKGKMQSCIDQYQNLKSYVIESSEYIRPFYCERLIHGYGNIFLNMNVSCPLIMLNFNTQPIECYNWYGVELICNNVLKFLDNFEQVKDTYIYKFKNKTGGSYYKKYLKYKTKYLKLKKLKM